MTNGCKLGLALLSVSMLIAEAQHPVAGLWKWAGDAGWQRITLNLEVHGGNLSGLISMGPGLGQLESSEQFWEYFFEPLTVKISDGTIEGDTITFSHLDNGSTLDYRGTVDADLLHLTRVTHRAWGDEHVTFTLARENNTALQLPHLQPIQETFRSRLDVIVLDSNDEPVTDLGRQDFVVQVDGTPHDLLDVDPPRGPWPVLLLFDGNLLRRGYLWSTIADAVGMFSSMLPPDTPLSLAVFDQGLATLLDWRRAGEIDGQVLRTSPLLSDDSPSEGPDLYGTLRSILSVMPSGRSAVVVMTDGRDQLFYPQWFHSQQHEILDPLFGLPTTSELHAFDQTLSAVASSGVRLFFLTVESNQPQLFGQHLLSGLYFGIQDALDTHTARTRKRLETLSNVSDGFLLAHQQPWEVIDRYRELAAALALSDRYTLRIPDASTDSSFDVRTRSSNFRVVWPSVRP